MSSATELAIADPRRERLAALGRRAVIRLGGGLLVLWAVAPLRFLPCV